MAVTRVSLRRLRSRKDLRAETRLKKDCFQPCRVFGRSLVRVADGHNKMHPRFEIGAHPTRLADLRPATSRLALTFSPDRFFHFSLVPLWSHSREST